MDTCLKKGFYVLVLIFSLNTAVLANGYFDDFSEPTTPIADSFTIPAEDNFSGAYVGVGGGIVAATTEVKNSTSMNVENQHLHSYGSDNFKSLGKFGFNANIFGGFGRVFQEKYYLGGEIFGDYNSPKTEDSYDYYVIDDEYETQHLTNIDVKVENHYSFGGDIRVGYTILPKAMIYLLIGLNYAYWDVNTQLVGGKIESGKKIIPTVTSNFNKWLLGIMPGLGAEMKLSDCISLRLEYTHNFYCSFNRDIKESGTIRDKYGDNHQWSSLVSTKIDPSSNLFTLKLSYLF